MLVAIQGDTASFHHQAAKRWLSDGCEIVPCDTFVATFKVVEERRADLLIVAIENSLYGGINQVYDLIERYNYPIVGEIHLPIHHQLIGTPKTPITHIYSHPVALAQCEQYLDVHYPDAERIEHHDTAAAVEHVKLLGDSHSAAIASREAAELHSLPIIARNIEDNPANFTRFLVLEPSGVAPADANRTSLVITTDHAPGALARILTIFADRSVNLSKLQSRPIIGSPWKYKFYMVIDEAGESLNETLRLVQPLTASLRVLGSYRHDRQN